jgi:hypothetical protein
LGRDFFEVGIGPGKGAFFVLLAEGFDFIG